MKGGQQGSSFNTIRDLLDCENAETVVRWINKKVFRIKRIYYPKISNAISGVSEWYRMIDDDSPWEAHRCFQAYFSANPVLTWPERPTGFTEHFSQIIRLCTNLVSNNHQQIKDSPITDELGRMQSLWMLKISWPLWPQPDRWQLPFEFIFFKNLSLSLHHSSAGNICSLTKKQ